MTGIQGDFNPKSEAQNPKSGRNPKPECRIRAAARHFTWTISKRLQSHLKIRIPDFELKMAAHRTGLNGRN